MAGGRRGVLPVVFLTLFLDLVGFSIVFPLFAEKLKFYMARDTGLLQWAMAQMPLASADHQAALFGGLLGALYAGLQFFAAPLWGRLSDRIGRRPVLLCSLTGSVLAYVLWVFSASFTLFFISRIIAGAMSGNVATANAAVADVTTPETRSRGMAAVGMAFGLGFVLGPAIGGLSAEWLLGPTTSGDFGLHPFSGPAAIAGGLAVLNLGLAIFVFPETNPPENRAAIQPGRTSNIIQMLDPKLGKGVPQLNLAFMFYTLIFSGMEATLIFLADQKLHFTPTDLGWMFAGMGLGSAAVQGAVYRRHAERIGVRKLGLIGLACLIPGFLLIGLVDWFPYTWLMVAGISLLSASTGLVFPALSTLVSVAGDPQRQGWVMGAFRSSSAFGRAVGPLLAANIYFWWRPGGTYFACAVLVAIPLLLIVRLRHLR